MTYRKTILPNCFNRNLPKINARSMTFMRIKTIQWNEKTIYIK